MYINDKWNNFDQGFRNDSNGNENDDEEYVWHPIYVYIMYTIFAIIPNKQNIYLIIGIMRHECFKLNMFYTIVHWSFANLLHSILPIYMAYVPEVYKNETMTLAFYAAHSIISAFTLTIVICFIFNEFIDSKDFCRKMIRRGWLILIVCLAVVLPLVCTNILKESWIGYVYIVYSSIALLIYILRLFYYCCISPKTEGGGFEEGEEEDRREQTEEEKKESNACLRLLMAFTFVVSSYVFTVSWIMNIMGNESEWVAFVFGMFLIVANGFINFSTIYGTQPQLRSTLRPLMMGCFICCAKKQERDTPPRHEDDYEWSSNKGKNAKVNQTYLE